MNWEDIKLSHEKIYPANSITVFMMDTESGKPATHWVDKAYKSYPYKKECMFNCFMTVDLTDGFNSKKQDLDIADIEKYFTAKLREVCVCHLVARITTDHGINLELYVDDVENTIHKLNELEADADRLVNFNCEINDDENWENVAGILS
jgi:hypothetical protein